MKAGLGRIVLSPLLWIFILALLILPACSTAAKPAEQKVEFMFWPPAPDVPHIQFLTSISSTADVTQKQDRLSNFLYGEDATSEPAV